MGGGAGGRGRQPRRRGGKGGGGHKVGEGELEGAARVWGGKRVPPPLWPATYGLHGPKPRPKLPNKTQRTPSLSA